MKKSIVWLAACFLGWLTDACLSALLWLPAPLIYGLLIRLTARLLGRLTGCRLFVSLTVASCPAYLWLTDQACCRMFVSLTVASCLAYLWLTDQAYCMLLRLAYCRLFVSLTVAS